MNKYMRIYMQKYMQRVVHMHADITTDKHKHVQMYL